MEFGKETGVCVGVHERGCVCVRERGKEVNGEEETKKKKLPSVADLFLGLQPL